MQIDLPDTRDIFFLPHSQVRSGLRDSPCTWWKLLHFGIVREHNLHKRTCLLPVDFDLEYIVYILFHPFPVGNIQLHSLCNGRHFQSRFGTYHFHSACMLSWQCFLGKTPSRTPCTTRNSLYHLGIVQLDTLSTRCCWPTRNTRQNSSNSCWHHQSWSIARLHIRDILYVPPHRRTDRLNSWYTCLSDRLPRDFPKRKCHTLTYANVHCTCQPDSRDSH